MNLTNKETYFTLDGGCDRKNKLLRSTARLTEAELARLDSGTLSLEDLEAMVARRARIFKYRTQITVHAGFPGEVAQRVNGYSFLVNNRNGSVGVRYGAIDEAKRKRLSRFLEHEGFRYEKNSSSHGFVRVKRFGKEREALDCLTGWRTEYDYRALRELIFGRIELYCAQGWGNWYAVLLITVNAIPEANIPEFLRLMRCKSGSGIAAIEETERLEREERNRRNEEERLQRQAREHAAAAGRRAEILDEMRAQHRSVTAWPEGDHSLCVVTDTGRRIVVKQFRMKNGRLLRRKFIQRDKEEYYNQMPGYQKWNMLIPPHACMDTSRLKDEQIERYMAEGAVFTL